MNNVRRWYTYIVSFIALQGVTWAIIALLRNIFLPATNELAVAFQIAVIIIGLPVFLGHWLWSQREAAKDEDERESVVRHLYLYGTLAAFLTPFVTNLYDLLGSLLRASGTLDRRDWLSRRYDNPDWVIYHLLAVIILGLFWFYHQRVTAETTKDTPEVEGAATIRRLYIYGFSAGGLTIVTLAVIHLIRWIMNQFGAPITSSNLFVRPANEFVRLLIGVPLWVIFWRWAVKFYRGPDPTERESALRKFYLHGTVFIAAMSVVVNSTAILASLFKRLFGVPPEGDIRQPLPTILGTAVLWGFHYMIIREEADDSETTEQAGVLRMYRYLTAGIGFAALLTGVSGILSVIIRSFEGGFIGDLREQLGWFMAAVVVGLLVWVFPFRIVQGQTTDEGAPGAEARRSLARKIYLYVFLFVSVMTVLSSGVFIVFRILTLVLGIDTITLSELAHALGFTIIAVLTWLFHGVLLRSDRKRSEGERLKEVAALDIALLDFSPGSFGEALAHALGKEIPGLELEPILLDAPAPARDEMPEDISPLEERLAQAGLIVAPWTVFLPQASTTPGHPALPHALAESPARKLLVPMPHAGWDWAGAQPKDRAALVKQTAHAIQQIIEGEEVKVRKPLGCSGWLAILVGIGILLSVASALLEFLF